MSNPSIKQAISELEKEMNTAGHTARTAHTVTVTISTWADVSPVVALTGLAKHPNSHDGCIGITGKGDGVIKAKQDGLTGQFNKPIVNVGFENKAESVNVLSDKTLMALLDLIGNGNGYVRRAVVKEGVATPKTHTTAEGWEFFNGVRRQETPEAERYTAKCRNTVKAYVDNLNAKVRESVKAREFDKADTLAREVDRLNELLGE